MLLARTKEAAAALRTALSHEAGVVVPYRIAEEGLRVKCFS
jgi:hypothetical protein